MARDDARPALLTELAAIGDRFVFAQSYDNLAEIEDEPLRSRGAHRHGAAAAGRSTERAGDLAGRWQRRPLPLPRDQRHRRTTRASTAGIKRLFGDLPHRIFGRQFGPDLRSRRAAVPERRRAASISTRPAPVFIYPSAEPRHLHYSPLEAMVVGTPVALPPGRRCSIVSPASGSRVPAPTTPSCARRSRSACSPATASWPSGSARRRRGSSRTFSVGARPPSVGRRCSNEPRRDPPLARAVPAHRPERRRSAHRSCPARSAGRCRRASCGLRLDEAVLALDQRHARSLRADGARARRGAAARPTRSTSRCPVPDGPGGRAAGGRGGPARQLPDPPRCDAAARHRCHRLPPHQSPPGLDLVVRAGDFDLAVPGADRAADRVSLQRRIRAASSSPVSGAARARARSPAAARAGGRRRLRPPAADHGARRRRGGPARSASRADPRTGRQPAPQPGPQRLCRARRGTRDRARRARRRRWMRRSSRARPWDSSGSGPRTSRPRSGRAASALRRDNPGIVFVTAWSASQLRAAGHDPATALAAIRAAGFVLRSCSRAATRSGRARAVRGRSGRARGRRPRAPPRLTARERARPRAA